MPYTREHPFDEAVIDRLNAYIYQHDLSIRKIADASGMSYMNLYQLLHKNQTVKLREYVSLCKAFNEPLDKFLPIKK